MSIKSSELRIGNLMQSLKGEVLTISGIDETQEVSVSKYSKKWTVGWKLQPIPLTEDWLLRFDGRIAGIKPYRDQPAYMWGQDANRYIFSGGYIHKPLPEGFIRLNQVPIEAVHTFQNSMFALIGQELETKKYPATEYDNIPIAFAAPYK